MSAVSSPRMDTRLHSFINSKRRWKDCSDKEGADKLYTQATLAAQQQDFKKAYKLFVQAADKGDPQSRYTVGMMHEEGLGVTKDSAQAVKHYRQSAEAGCPMAQCNLANLYYPPGDACVVKAGEGPQERKAEAMRLYRLAADQGQPEAVGMLKQIESVEVRMWGGGDAESTLKANELDKEASAACKDAIANSNPGVKKNLKNLRKARCCDHCGAKAPTEADTGMAGAMKAMLGLGGVPKAGVKIMYCTRCKIAKYCGKECQLAAWKGHKEECTAQVERNKLEKTDGPDFKALAGDFDLAGAAERH